MRLMGQVTTLGIQTGESEGENI